jgi:endonuclease YncB( thermonuclease family)
MRSLIHSVLVTLLVLFCALPARAEGTVGGMAAIIDARTFDVAGERVRLHGIDAPDRDQTCGEWVRSRMQDYRCGDAAYAFLASLVAGREVFCVEWARDEAGRLLGLCFVDGRDIARVLVLAGWAVADTAHSSRYAGDQEAAKAAGRGLWAGAFDEPSKWRGNARD